MKLINITNIIAVLVVICSSLWAGKNDHLKELKEKRNYFNKTYYDSTNKTFTTKIYANYIHYKDRDGKFKPINTSIIKVDSSEYDYEVTKGLYHAYFKADLKKTNPVKFQLPNGRYFVIQPMAIAYVNKETGERIILSKLKAGKVSIENNVITYRDVFDDVDIRYTYKEKELREEFIFTEKFRDKLKSPSEYGFQNNQALLAVLSIVDYSDDLMAEDEAGLELDKKSLTNRKELKKLKFKLNDKKQFSLAEDVSYSAYPDSSSGVEATDHLTYIQRETYENNGLTVMQSGIEYFVFTQYPKGAVIFDPTFQMETEAVEDVWLENTSNKNYYTMLLLAKQPYYPKKRSLIKFDLSSIPSGSDILSAGLNVRYYAKGGPATGWVDRPVRVYRMTRNWIESQATSVKAFSFINWTGILAEGDYDPAYTDEETFQLYTYEWKSFDVESIVQDWVSETYNNYGFMLKATNEDTDGCDVRMYSSEHATVSNRPYLEVTYQREYITAYYLKDHLGDIRVTVDDEGTVLSAQDYYPFGLEMPGRSYNKGYDRNIYKYSSKELDEEQFSNGTTTGALDWYYFGARYYDPEIGRFLTIDRFADKYPSLSPYQYAANNPLLFIDVNGDSLWITGDDGNDYLYVNDDQFLEQYGADALKKNAFLARTIVALSMMGGTELGSEILGQLTQSLNNFTIQSGDQSGNTLGSFESDIKEFAMDGTGSGGLVTISSKIEDSFNTLIHELGHAYNSDLGIQDNSFWTMTTTKTGVYRPVGMEELRVISSIQNPILKELNQRKLQEYYGSIQVSMYNNPGLNVGFSHPLFWGK